MTARIVLIDSGVNESHPHIEGMGRIEVGPTVDSDGALSREDPQIDHMGHGTAAAAAILDLAPESTIYTIKVFHEVPDCPIEHILLALDDAIAEAPDIINLSLGTPRDTWRVPFTRSLAQCTEAGITLVSPATFSGLPCYPGHLDGATGVIPDPNVPRETPEERLSGDRSFWHASPYPRDLPGLPRAANLSGASMATANVTGFLAARRR